MNTIESFDWDKLYESARLFLESNVPDSAGVVSVDRGCQSMKHGHPYVDITFPLKGNSRLIKFLNGYTGACKLRGYISGTNARVCRYALRFNDDYTVYGDGGK